MAATGTTKKEACKGVGVSFVGLKQRNEWSGYFVCPVCGKDVATNRSGNDVRKLRWHVAAPIAAVNPWADRVAREQMSAERYDEAVADILRAAGEVL